MFRFRCAKAEHVPALCRRADMMLHRVPFEDGR